MKKIGILTFHSAHNYGAVLQAYALQQFLIKNVSKDSNFIDYLPQYIQSEKKLFDLGSGFRQRSLLGKIRYILKLPLTYSKRIRRIDKFNSFINEYLVIDNDKVYKQKKYDLIIVGSDQIWNTKLTKGPDSFYGGYSNSIHAKRKITYAASLGTLDPSEDKNTMISYISNFDDVSLRENKYIKYLENLSNKKISQVLDPVFLLDDDSLQKITHSVQEDKYILVYQVHMHRDVLRIAEMAAKQLNCKIIQLRPSVTILNHTEVSDSASVNEFVSLFKHAEFVITTSFHGTAFSILNKKPFYTIRLGNSVDIRSLDLLSTLGLEERSISLDVTQIRVDNLDYTKASKKLEELKEQSKRFIINNVF